MARVVYFLGAGFSQPLGVPTIGEFLIKAKDQLEHAPTKYSYFQPLLARLDSLHKAGTFFESDVTNIEEILSLLEADAFVNEPDLKQQFKRLICDVVRYYTPRIVSVPTSPGNWQPLVFGSPIEKWNPYGYFTLALLNLQLGIHSSGGIVVMDENGPASSYAVVTTNYDLVLENVCDYINTASHFLSEKKRAFHRASGTRESTLGTVVLTKLHGSIDDCDIVPPTWSKGATPEYTVPWNLALAALSQAQEIRIIGYSLPEGDTYVRYLLKAAAIRNPDLRKVHVLCWDPEQKAGLEKRYGAFVRRGLKFSNTDSWVYLQRFHEALLSNQKGPSHALEHTHGSFFGR